MYILAFATLFFMSCNGNSNQSANNNEMAHQKGGHDHEDHDHADHDHGDHDHGSGAMQKTRKITPTSSKNASTSAILDGYLEIKNGLVGDDKAAAAKGGQAFLKALSSFDMSSVSKETHMEFMDIFNDAKEQAEHIVKSPIDHQREHFEVLSTDINDMIDLVGTDKKLYQDFCPMANDGKGAIWISEISDIRNPFFGSKMMKCGKIQKEYN